MEGTNDPVTRPNHAPAYLAVDLGADSGRLVRGQFNGARVELTEVHRFPNGPVRIGDGLHWDVPRLFGEIKDGLAQAARDRTGLLVSIGIDSWGCDFGLLDRTGALIANPLHHRDPRTAGMLERAFVRVPRAEIYRITGVQFLPLNTLYQLLALEDSPLLAVAETLLLIPDLFVFWLGGELASEATNATTTQLYDFTARDWAWSIIERLGLPAHLFPTLVEPGTPRGVLCPDIAAEIGLTAPPTLTTVASHDTASAVAAVPAEGADFAYISSGTWSLVGLELAAPIVTDAALAANFANEGGAGGTTRFLKNVAGLWLLQECRRAWARTGTNYSYDDLVRLAAVAPPFGPLIDPNHPSFLQPGDLPARIRAFCCATNQTPPDDPGATVRCVLESLALAYRHVLVQAATISGHRIGVVHVVGGGARNALLCQLTADATRFPVVAGPVEATALGNVLVQALAHGAIGSFGELRDVVHRSTEVQRFEPTGDADVWDAAAERFQRFTATVSAP